MNWLNGLIRRNEVLLSQLLCFRNYLELVRDLVQPARSWHSNGVLGVKVQCANMLFLLAPTYPSNFRHSEELLVSTEAITQT